MARVPLTLTVNGTEQAEFIESGTMLADFLRDKLSLMATKVGCQQGTCGACTVEIDGELALSCLVPAERAAGRSVVTLEGISANGAPHPLQTAFAQGFAAQCGFCTPGMIVAAKALLDRNPNPNRDEVVDAISGNICRCTGYEPIINAILSAAADVRSLSASADGRGQNRPEGRKMEHVKEFFANERQDGFKTVGVSEIRSDANGHVTGRTQFYADRNIAGLLHLKMVRSPHDHARILRVDTSEAEKVKGVVRILTHKDVPKNVYTILCLIQVEPDDEPVLAVDKVRFKGEAIVAVMAESAAAAREAVAKVKIDYEVLPAVFDVEEALKPSAPLVNEYHGQNYFKYEGHHCRRIRHGDVDKGFAAADHVIEERYQSSPIEHAPVETTGCIVVPEATGRFTCYSNSQAMYFTLDNAALILNLPFQKLRLVGGTSGGGFGGKVDVIVEPIAILGAMLTNRPVKFAYDREEEMQVSSPRAAERIYIKDGVMKDGRIVARQIRLYVDAGAYSRHSPYGTTKAAAHMPGPYTIPNVHVDAHCVYTNRTPSSAMRGFGVTIGDFALEVQMDKLARLVGMDPMEFRILNAYRDGDMKAHGETTHGAALVETIQAASKLANWPLGPRAMAASSLKRGG